LENSDSDGWKFSSERGGGGNRKKGNSPGGGYGLLKRTIIRSERFSKKGALVKGKKKETKSRSKVLRGKGHQVLIQQPPKKKKYGLACNSKTKLFGKRGKSKKRGAKGSHERFLSLPEERSPAKGVLGKEGGLNKNSVALNLKGKGDQQSRSR